MATQKTAIIKCINQYPKSKIKKSKLINPLCTFGSNVVIDPAKQALEKEQQDLIAQLQEENKVLKIQNELLLRIHKV